MKWKTDPSPFARSKYERISKRFIFEIFLNLIATFMQSCHAGLQNVKYGIGAEILVISHFSRNPRFGVVQQNSASYGNPLDEIYRSR